MNVFDAIYFNETDPIKRAFIAAETALDIAVSQAMNDYTYEMGLAELSDDSIFNEAGDGDKPNAKKENIFVKAVKGIFNAIRSFINGIIDTIKGIFSKDKHISEEDYAKSEAGRKQLEQDIAKLDKVSDAEILKGRKLLQKASSATGIPDTEIDAWSKAAMENIKNAAPVVIPVAAASITNAIVSFLNKKKKSVDDCEPITMEGSNGDESSKSKLKIVRAMQNIVKGCTKPFTNIPDKELVQDRKKARRNYESIEVDYLSGKIDDRQYLDLIKMLATKDEEIIRAYGEREAERRQRAEWDKTINALTKKAHKKLDDDIKSKKKTKENAESLKTYVDMVRGRYLNSKRDAADYKTAVDGLKNHILNRK